MNTALSQCARPLTDQQLLRCATVIDHRASRQSRQSAGKAAALDYQVRPPPPALSPREGVTAVASRSIKRIRMFERRATVLPLPWGGGRGEGEGRVAFLTVSLVRSKHAVQAGFPQL